MKIIAKTWIFVRNVRLPQFLFFMAVLAVGLATAVSQDLFDWQDVASWQSVVKISLVVLAIWLAWAGSVAQNDAFDVAIDRLTNSTRPLPRGQFTSVQFAQIGYILPIIAFLLASVVDMQVGFLLGVFVIINYIYNTPPLRLKRILFVGSLLPAIAIQMIAYMGFLVIAPISATLGDYPYSVLEVALAVLVLAFILPIKDIKDVKSDKLYGVKTFPVVIGVRATQLMVVVAIGVFLIMRMLFMGTLSMLVFVAVSGILLIVIVILFALGVPGIKPRSLIAWMMLPMIIYVALLWITYFT